MKKKKENEGNPDAGDQNPKPTHEEGKRWLCIALANISEFWFSEHRLVKIYGLDLTKANMCLCTVAENISVVAINAKSDLLDELGHLSSTTEDEATMILWKSSVLFVTDDDENKKEEGNKKKFHIDVMSRSIRFNHGYFSSRQKSRSRRMEKAKTSSGQEDGSRTHRQKFKIIASNFDAEEGECIRVLKY